MDVRTATHPGRHTYTPHFAAPPAVVVAHGVVLQGPSLWAELHRGPALAWEMNPVKGRLGEELLARVVTGNFLGRTGTWVPCTPARIGNAGIDGIYFKVDAAGNIRDVIVAEAKWGSSRLQLTRDGMQMSSEWIARRLRQTAAEYACARGGEPMRSWSPPPPGTPRLTVPLPNGRSVDVWVDRDGRLNFNGQGSDSALIERQISRVVRTLHGMAEGKISFRAKLFRVGYERGDFALAMHDVDPVTGTIRADATLDAEISRRLTADALRKVFRDSGLSADEADALAAKAAEDPEFFAQMTREARWSLAQGLDRKLFARAAAAALVAFAAELLRQLWRREFSLARLVSVSGSAAVGGAVGHYVGIQATTMLRTTTMGQRLLGATPLRALGTGRASAALGGTAGGVLGGLVVAYGLWLAGLIDLRTANRQVVAAMVGAAGAAGATTGAVAAVGAWGVAGTGTAIVELSGAAASNATLAWFGGGSVASGGLGMGVGASVLTAGAALVGLALAAGTSWVFAQLDENERRRLVEGRMKLTFQRVQTGRQAEWARG